MYTGNQLRDMFLKFFQDKSHTLLPSASLIPKDDPSLLLTVAGMVPFKPYFMRRAEPPAPRVTTCQKCVRTPDLEEVGRTARHHTCFEMLGNFSFGDYFKTEAIVWAWEFVTEVLEIPARRLWVTIHPEDEEARGVWLQAGVAAERILKDETNFWAAGPVGPCGPCSEIYVDLGAQCGCGEESCAVGCDCDRFLEIWNLVFMESFRDGQGVLTPLPQQNIDTGMGLERITAVMQGARTNFDTDLFRPLIDRVAAISGIPYEAAGSDGVTGSDDAGLGTGLESPDAIGDVADARQRMAMKVVADHSRCVVFMLGDGIRPSSDGRGYVLRRILRRAVRYARLLGIEKPFLEDMYALVLDHYGHYYPQLKENQMFILNHLRLEEKNFQATLEQGMRLLQDHIDRFKGDGNGGTRLGGEEAFRLYETYGFPVELTEEILAEHDIAVDMAGYETAMERHRQLAREKSRSGQGHGADSRAGDYDSEVLLNRATELGPTRFVGYEGLSHKTTVKALIMEGKLTSFAGEGDVALCLLAETPFYAESGGQVSDQGFFIGDGADAVLVDIKKLSNGVVVHRIEVKQGVLKTGDAVEACVKSDWRLGVMRHHSATHLLHAALRHVLGDHVQQAGSLVLPDRLRFDFSHFAPVSSEELLAAEDWANEQVLTDYDVTAEEMSLAAANERGATALFGEKYGDRVRVVTMGRASMELCGGTHVGRTGSVGLIKIVAESGIGAGLRRIEAIAGTESLRYFRKVEAQVREVAEVLKTSPAEVGKRAEQAVVKLKEQEQKLQHLAQAISRHQMDKLLEKVVVVEGVAVLSAKVQAGDMDALRRDADLLRDKMPEGVIVLGAIAENKVNLVTVVKPSGLKSLHAGKIIKDVAAITGGSGGGRPDIAQAGGKEPARLGEALDRAVDIVRRHLTVDS
ncbi:MAG: alanine--tRNA ligase [Peptococcaceae bacterium]|nr:alanine--tRNA ligase [Peptococcaceae bacterium]